MQNNRPIILALVNNAPLHDALSHHTDKFDLRWSLPGNYQGEDSQVVEIATLFPALIIIELDRRADWLPQVRSDPATRRLPVIAIADDDSAQAQAAIAKADAIFKSGEFIAALPDVITRYARLFSDSDMLNTECESALSAEVLKGLHEFNTHEYFECHETLESAWNHESGPVRNLYRVILQVGLAYYQIERGNFRGAQKMFRRSWQWFAVLPDHCQGIDVAQLRADATAAWEHLEALKAEPDAQFDRSLLKPVIYKIS